jgi:hypothetical protein
VRSVDVASVPNGHDQHEEPVVINFVDDAVIAGFVPPLAAATHQLSGGRRPWLVGKQVDGGLDASPGVRIQFAKLTGGGRGEGDPIRHAKPSSALTSSQGIGASPIPWDRLQLGAGLFGGADIGHVLGERDYAVQVIRMYYGRNPVSAAGKKDRAVLCARARYSTLRCHAAASLLLEAAADAAFHTVLQAAVPAAS